MEEFDVILSKLVSKIQKEQVIKLGQPSVSVARAASVVIDPTEWGDKKPRPQFRMIAWDRC